MAIDMAVWMPPLATVIAGGVAAYVLLAQTPRSDDGDARVLAEGRRNDLQQTHEEVVEQLKHLETEREKLSPEEFDAEWKRLLERGSRALEALEAAGLAPAAAPGSAPAPSTAAPAPAAPAPAPIGAEWKGALYALAAVALVWLLWTMLQGQATDRGQGSMTGNLPGEVPGGGGPAPDPTQSPEFKAREAALQGQITADPKNVEALNEMTFLYLSHGVPEKAFDWSKKTMEVDPKNEDARTYRAVISAMMGMMDPAVAALDAVLSENPTHQLALVYKGLILLELGRFEDAAKALEVASAQDPENRMLKERLAEARAGGKGGPAPAAGGDLLVAGTIDLAPDAKAALKGGETLFLSLSEPGKPGPPVAADRLSGPFTFPLAFDLTTADIRAMGAGGVPETMELKVRFDADGNAMTKEAGLPLAVVTAVGKGTRGLPVVLTLAGTPTPAPEGLPRAAPAPAPMPGGGGGDAIASGRVTLGPGVKATGTEVVFIIVKNPAGPPMPVAVKRLPPVFPLDFSVTTADMMAGPGPVPDQVTVLVRLDADGNATTKDGPTADAGTVARGASGLSLTLQ